MAGHFHDRLRSTRATFSAPDSINRQITVLDQVDTVLVDSTTRPMFGPLDTGRIVEIGDRKVTIGGRYVLGTGFMGLGVGPDQHSEFCAAVSWQRGSALVNLGAIQLKAGSGSPGARRVICRNWPEPARGSLRVKRA